jgi:beta-lactamase regulating signal transducer with metallopeptidase domain
VTILEQIGFRLFFAAFVGLLAAASIDLDRNRYRSRGLRCAPDRYGDFVAYGFLFFPLMLLLLPSKAALYLHGQFSLLFNQVLMTVLLLAWMPRLRRRFSARTCAGLWVLPGLSAYFSMNFGVWRLEFDPFLVIRLSRSVLWTLLWIWLAGACGVLLWKLLSHLFFRKHILENAVQAEQREYGLMAAVYQSLAPSAQGLAKRRKSAYYSQCRQVEAILDHRHMLRSPEVSTPLTIGLTKKNTFLVLPDRAYSRGELALILRHEVVHLLHDDIHTKFSLALLCAAGWFIPSLWFGMEFVSEDLELCCDEMVTEGMGTDERKEYAGLLLRAGGTERGFTSCLSASARGLRYRLKRILRPKRREGGLSMLGLAVALFIFFSGAIGIREKVGTAQNAILDEGWQICAVQFPSQDEDCTDPAILKAVEEQFRSLKLESELWKDRHSLYAHGISSSKGELSLILAREDEERMRVVIYPNRIAVYTGKNSKPTVYLTSGELTAIEN